MRRTPPPSPLISTKLKLVKCCTNEYGLKLANRVSIRQDGHPLWLGMFYVRFLYSLLFYLALPYVLIRLLWRSRHLPAYRERFLERFGFYPIKLEKCLWVHAV